MLQRLFALACVASLASAQQTIHLDEDFDNGATDWLPAEYVPFWHITAPGECGAPGGFASSAFAQNPCRYGSPGWAWSSELRSPHFVPDGGPLELHFLSRLAIDIGDHATAYLEPPSGSSLPRILFGDERSLNGDGNTESVMWRAPEAEFYEGLECRLVFALQHDGVGDLGAGWMIDEVELIETEVARPFCFSDGVSILCPCGNFTSVQEGCVNSSGAGAVLSGAGSARASLDNLRLRLNQAPANAPALLFRGLQSAPQSFRDGLLCCGAPQVRIAAVRLDAGGRYEFDEPLASLSGAAPGVAHRYQVWFRDPQGACGTGSNLSSALAIDWF